MKILAAVDSFKGSLSSIDAGNTIRKAALSINDAIDFEVIPIADGGEGTVDAFLSLSNAQKINIKVKDPLMRDTNAYYAKINDLCVMEMSQASGITKLTDDEKNPLLTTTYGVGEMIIDALDKDMRKFIIGIGSSATNDCGMGMLMALGVKFTDKEGKEVSNNAKGISDIYKIDISNMDKRIYESEFYIASDVDNPLIGEKGASNVYGRQKGADDDMVKLLDKILSHFADKTEEIIDSDRFFKGAGAAGGLGYAFKYYLKGKLSSGIDIVFDYLKVEDKIKDADLVITGEGKIDFQTSMGKAPIGIAKYAKKYNKKVIAFCAVSEDDAIEVNKNGIDAFFTVQRQIVDLDKAMDRDFAKDNLYHTALQVFRLINLYGGL